MSIHFKIQNNTDIRVCDETYEMWCQNVLYLSMYE